MIVKAFLRTTGKLGADRRGNFAMMFALMAMPLLLAAGTAVDITRAYGDRTDMENALDAAVLSTAKALSNSSIQQADAGDYLRRMFMGNLVSTSLDTTSVAIGSVDFDGTSNTLSAQATYNFKASFGVFGNAGNFPLTASSAASYGDGRAEVAMAFDLTGSMQGSKLSALKSAAMNGIEKLLAANSSDDPRIRIAAVPYAAAVNVGPDLAKYIYPDNGRPNTVAPVYDPNNPVKTSAKISDTCATERKGPEQFSDAAPDKGMINRDGRLYSGDPCPTATIVPLTTDKSRLETEIKGFSASGTTAGHIAIQWAWYMLSNKWANFMPDGAGAAPADPKLHKYAIIMTDGEFNTAYAGVKGNNVTSQAGTSSDDAISLCTKMKADGIQIFTIGFDLKQKSAIQTLQACASPARNGVSYFYNASTGDELNSVYQQIAAMIQKLRLIS